MKATAIAPSNIAFIKYWGKKNKRLRLPTNGSISMNLSNLQTTTTVEFSPRFKNDEVIIDGEKDINKTDRVIKHLDRIRKIANLNDRAKVVSKNNFPSDTGLSSSASAFAALTLAGISAAGINMSKKELSILARQGSGSACRSIPDGFVEWLDGETSDTSYAVSLYPPDYWHIADVVAIISNEKKEVSSTGGQEIVKSSPFFLTRLNHMRDKIEKLKLFLRERNFRQFGELIEAEALELHAIMITSQPSLIYWLPETVIIMKLVKKLRKGGLPVYFTINTGQDVHLIVEQKNIQRLLKKLKLIRGIKNLIVNYPAGGAKLTENHLF